MKKILFVGLLSLFLCSLNSCVIHTRTPRKKVVYIKHPPKNHQVVLVKGKRYYHWDSKYYKKTPNGFVVVKVY